MSDIPLIKTLVTIEPITVSGTAQNTTQTPNPLSTLTNGTFVDGFVVNRNPQNQPILRTSAGDVLLNTQLFLKTGTEVTIRVDNTQPNLARIITINGQSPEIFAEHQRSQLAVGASDSLSSQMASAVSSSNSATPKPVLLQGLMLQLIARDTLPAPIADALFKALGVDKNTRAAPPNNSAPLSIILRSITMPNPTPQSLPQAAPNAAQPTTATTATVPHGPAAAGGIEKIIPSTVPAIEKPTPQQTTSGTAPAVKPQAHTLPDKVAITTPPPQHLHLHNLRIYSVSIPHFLQTRQSQ